MGLVEVAQAFARARAQDRPALMPYWPSGYPDVDASLRVIEAIACAGADAIELGVPFSDPLADGPVVQHATQRALANGMTVQRAIELLRRARHAGVGVPIFAMGYLNPVLAFGEQRYVQQWADAGADGLIVPDLPPEESGSLGALCERTGLALVQFAAPTSTKQRLDLAVRAATGFIYVVSVTGVTGPRDRLAEGLPAYVERVKACVAEAGADTPVVVGFGISRPEHVQEVGRYADGVIVGAALVRAAGDAADPAAAAADFVRGLRG